VKEGKALPVHIWRSGILAAHIPTSTVDSGEWSVSRRNSGRCALKRRMGGPRARVSATEKRKISVLVRN